MSPENPAFSIAERDAVYRAIPERRGICHFVPDAVAPEVLARLMPGWKGGVQHEP
ncbi:hypothetical protein [Marinobacterium rhizophilum]|uniref:Uncharacterized protein n=1 Tax=Marinobacterium rhizophilum TaxID=420402 RepID=A0ABY5HJY8_9GAMM|nr:hypothetical protein [Marinobacterium rhizophilum]UTW12706.1 hypothetical protein KDW95_03230 [Marinobacterium rhizophilum]